MEETPDPPVRALAARIEVPIPGPVSKLAWPDLLAAHRQGLIYFRRRELHTGVSWLEVKRWLAWRLLSRCDFCVHQCQVNRLEEQTGYCRLGAKTRISGEYLHYGEEAAVGITHAIFFSACTMHCVFCHNWRETFDSAAVQECSTAWLAGQIAQRCQRAEVKSVSFIGGTPEPHLHTLTELACLLDPALKQIWVFNGNATLSAMGLDLMEGLIDLYLPDFKFGNAACAWNLARIRNYPETVRNNLHGYLTQGRAVLVRHLLMPGHLKCCTWPILEILAREFPTVMLNLMGQYRPFYQAENLPGLNHRLDPEDLCQARAHALALGLQLVT